MPVVVTICLFDAMPGNKETSYSKQTWRTTELLLNIAVSGRLRAGEIARVTSLLLLASANGRRHQTASLVGSSTSFQRALYSTSGVQPSSNMHFVSSSVTSLYLFLLRDSSSSFLIEARQDP